MVGGALKTASMDDLDLRMSEGVRPLYDAVTAFIRDEVDPITEEFHRLGEDRAERWSWAPGQLELLDGAKAKARAQGLWNFFLPNAETGQGLSNLDYAYIANELGKNRLASECLNCSAPDTGNMEVLERVGTPEQKKQWLEPLLRGEIRSAYAMTEPGVMSSDAKQIQTVRRARRRRVGDQRREVLHLRRRRSPLQDHDHDGAHQPRRRHLQAAVADPRADRRARRRDRRPDVRVRRRRRAPRSHAHPVQRRARAARTTCCWGEGRGFEISQVRLGPGRIHHCMRSIGAAERAIEMMVDRGLSREGFGKKLINLGKNMEVISRARIEVEAMRLMVLRAAKAMDTLGNAEARVWVSAVKAMVPEKCCDIIDEAIQMHGAAGISQWFPLADMWHSQRTLRLADGPDEVHHQVVGRAEAKSREADRSAGPARQPSRRPHVQRPVSGGRRSGPFGPFGPCDHRIRLRRRRSSPG